jgi:hypothetical protein
LVVPLPPALNLKGIDDATLTAMRQNRCARRGQVRDKIVNFGRLSIMSPSHAANRSSPWTVHRTPPGQTAESVLALRVVHGEKKFRLFTLS